MQLSEPTVIERPEQAYVSIKESVTMQSIGEVLPPLHAELDAWLEANGVTPADAPFWKYNVIDMTRGLQVEVGTPVTTVAASPVAERVQTGMLPAGRYATATHTGHPAELEQATAALLKWAADQGLVWDRSDSAEGERWAARLEIYRTDPAEEPDMSMWVTDLAFKLA